MKIQVKNTDSNPKKRLIVSKDTSQTISCLIALLILIVLFSVMSPYFLSSDNLANVLTQIITTALLGFGMTYVIISGEIDLSIAPTLAMSSVIVATLLSKGYPMIICCLGGVSFGILLGLVNGLLITKLSLPSFVATIGTQMAIRGLALVFTDSRAVYFSNRPEFKQLAQGRFLGIQYPVYIMLFVALIATFILRKTVIGRHSFGAKFVTITLGPRGCFYSYKGGEGHLPTYDVKVADTTGSGDAFIGGFIYQLTRLNMPVIEQIPQPDIERMLRFAHACGALCASRKGAMPSVENEAEVERCMQEVPILLFD